MTKIEYDEMTDSEFNKYVHLLDETNDKIIRYVNKFYTLSYSDGVYMKYINIEKPEIYLIKNDIQIGKLFYDIYPENTIKPIGYKYHNGFLCYLTYEVKSKNIKNFISSCNLDEFNIMINNLTDLITKISLCKSLYVNHLNLTFFSVVVKQNFDICIIDFEKTIVVDCIYNSSNTQIMKFNPESVLLKIFNDLYLYFHNTTTDIDKHVFDKLKKIANII